LTQSRIMHCDKGESRYAEKGLTSAFRRWRVTQNEKVSLKPKRSGRLSGDVLVTVSGASGMGDEPLWRTRRALVYKDTGPGRPN